MADPDTNTDTDIEFFFDPVCPFAWQTSRWMRIVAEQRDLTVDWRFICLRIINDDKEYATDFPPSYEEAHSKGRSLLRIAAAVREKHGREFVGPLYELMGTELWHQTTKEEGFEGIMGTLALGVDLKGILAELDLPTDLALEADNDGWDQLLTDESEAALARTGPDVGTPILSFMNVGGASYFGPVISSLPDVEESLRIYDAIVTLAGVDTFSELKRSNRADLDLPLLT